MKHVERDGMVWSIAESEQDKAKLTKSIEFLRANGLNHSFIYSGPPGQENPIVEELAVHHRYVPA